MRKIAFLACVAILGLACQSQESEPTIEHRLQTAVDAAVDGNDAVRSAALHADSAALGLTWEGAAGFADPVAGTPMSPSHPSRIASNTKTFVAAAVLRLMEEGELTLDDTIAIHLPEEYVTTLESDGYDSSAITVRHLLTHTAGLFDHTSPPVYVESIMADPMHRWTRAEQLRGAVDWGDPHGEPGEYYTYCDTGYVLLGAIIEHATGQLMADAVRGLLDYDRLGLNSTWWETFEPRPAGVPERAHQFLGDVDTADFDPSYDLYGGGGLVSTVADLARFYRALFTGGVYADPATAEIMLTTVDGAEPLPDAGERAMAPGVYRMGIWVTDIGGFTAYMHTGFFGTFAAYLPELDLAIAAAVNQNQDGGALRALAREAVTLVSEVEN